MCKKQTGFIKTIAVGFFFSFIASLMEPYLHAYQTDKPMLPFMCSDLKKLLTILLKLFVKPEVIDKCTSPKHHHHSFNVSVPLKVGCTAPMFVLSFILHSILFAGSALDSFQCLRSLLIVSFHVFFSLPRPRCPTTSNSVMLLIQPSFLTTCPNQLVDCIVIKFVCC